jgi:Domain of unknown function (DUF4424)
MPGVRSFERMIVSVDQGALRSKSWETEMPFRLTKLYVASAFFLVAAVFQGAHANDSAAELSVGGLTFTRSAEVSMESEDLMISPDLVTVRYTFRNNSANPVNITVAFPLPDIELADAENYAIPTYDPVNFVGFETKVDAKPIKLSIHQRAVLGTKDVTATLRGLAVPLLPVGAQQARLAELPQTVRDRLVEQGLLAESGTNEQGRPLYEATWTVKTSAVRQQTFAPNRLTTVEHRYRPSVGISQDTVLRKSLRQNKGMEREIERYRNEYCIEPAFLSALDKLAGGAEANTGKLQERRIAYRLKTGANWAGPIKDFRLVVDRQTPQRLVSFCAPNMKPISPTATEASAKDFTPDKDLKILIVGRF